MNLSKHLPSEKNQQMLDSLRQAVAQALPWKRKHGSASTP